MIEMAGAFVGGLLGSAHCVGMCGGLAAGCCASAAGSREAAGRSALFSLGRVFTYAFLGLLAGQAGASVAALPAVLVRAQRLVAVTVGLGLIVAGLASLGVWSHRRSTRGAGPRRGPSLTLLAGGVGWAAMPVWTSLRTFVGESALAAFLGGLFTGFLPCGLSTAFLALAAAQASAAEGALLMMLFGLGTSPLMVALGWGASRVSVDTRARMHVLAAVVVVALGALTIARGI